MKTLKNPRHEKSPHEKTLSPHKHPVIPTEARNPLLSPQNNSVIPSEARNLLSLSTPPRPPAQCTPNVKIGKYSEINTPPTKIAIIIKMTGSIRAMAAPSAVCTSSS